MDLKRNYGNNISFSCCKKKYIIGNKLNVCLVINMSFIFTIITICWILFLYKIYSIFIFLFGIVLYCLLLYYYLKCFFTEPGIIPRNYNKYIFKKETKENTTDSENNLFRIIDNKTKSTISLDIEEPSIKLEQTQEKENKIFPDFILAESNDDLKINDMNLNNSINTTTINENLYNKNHDEFKGRNVYIYSKKFKKKEENNMGDIITKIKDKNNDNTSNSYIPHIFTKRACNTCNIIRPSKASHCVICDNCILDFDHHCFYISNCIGVRNRKFFFLFLFYGFILSIFFIITSSYHFIFIINGKYLNLTKLLLKNYYIPISISFISMFIGLLILFIKKESLKLSCAIFIPGNILYDIFFYINKKKKIKIKLNDFEYHPFCLLLIYAIIPMFMFVIKYLRRQIKLIGKDLSTKQYMSIKEERNKNKNNKEIYDYLDSILKRKVKIKNIFSFLFKKQIKSLINT